MFTTLKSSAQPAAKDFLLGGNFGLTNNKAQYPDDSGYVERQFTSVKCNLQIGIFVTPRIAFGASIGFSQFNRKEKTVREHPTGVKITPVSKVRAIELSGGGFVSYYYPIREQLFWVNTLTYQHGYTGDGISIDSYLSNKTSTLARYGFNRYNITSEIQYFLNTSLCLTASTNLLLLNIEKNSYQITLLKKENLISIGLNYLLKNE